MYIDRCRGVYIYIAHVQLNRILRDLPFGKPTYSPRSWTAAGNVAAAVAGALVFQADESGEH